ncbi:MAG: hypothetical protein JO013_00010 [Alphaproteobacteria bacterium]|nr:hypothetical protein [Alphaproteobacteria bacterium]MBV9929317.1 hypothetical protein [Alphaproteobacteria bacterium]
MTRAPEPAGRPRYLAWLPAFLFRADGPAWRYVLMAWPLTLVPSLALGLVFGLLFPDLARPDFPLGIGLPFLLFLLVVVSPVVETLILLPVVLLLQRLFGSGPAAIVSAGLWALAHSLEAAGWGLVVWWPFLIMSITLLTWRARGLGAALGVTVAIHALQNAVAALLLVGGAG